jgi:hypothetical protein
VPTPAGSGDFDAEEAKEKKPALKTEAGLHRAVWNLRHEGAKKIKDAKIDFGDPEDGPLAVPGTYTARLTAAGKTASQAFKVVANPRDSTLQSELEAQLALSLAVRDDLSRVTEMVNGPQSIRACIKARQRGPRAMIPAPTSGRPPRSWPRAWVPGGPAAQPDGGSRLRHSAMRGGPISLAPEPAADVRERGQGAPTQGMRESAEMRRELAARGAMPGRSWERMYRRSTGAPRDRCRVRHAAGAVGGVTAGDSAASASAVGLTGNRLEVW